MKIIYCLIISVYMVGCSTPSHTWQGADRELLWSTMIIASKTPDYSSEDPRKRWIVSENYVAVDRQLGLIEVNRVLRRSLKLPRQKEQHDKRHWFFVIHLLPIDPQQPENSTATFDVSTTQFIPAQTLDEADRYFAQVDELLNK